MRLKVTITSTRDGKTATVYAKPPNIYGGIWHISERTRQAAFRRMGLDTQSGANPGVSASATIRAIDGNGWHTYTIWSA